jgi:hypothetical protein
LLTFRQRLLLTPDFVIAGGNSMEEHRDDKIRRRAFELWEQAGQRGTVEGYWEFAQSEIDAKFEATQGTIESSDPKVPLIP